MFVFLALVFAVGFVAFGVGSDVQGGIADAFRFGGDTGGTSLEDARETARENPKRPAAQRELATAALTAGNTDEAIAALETYTKLRPNDTDALSELAGLYLTKANESQQRAFVHQAEAQRFSVVQAVLPQLGSGPAATYFGDTTINQALAGNANEKFNRAAAEMQAAYDQAKQAFQRLAAAAPNDADAQLELATTAQQAGDTATAIAAYKRFVKLSPPDDPTVAEVRQQIAELQRSAATPTAG